MANPGGPNEIGELSVGIGGDLSGLHSALEQGKTDAAKGGEEIGKAAAEGMAKGAGGGFGGAGYGPYGGGFAGANHYGVGTVGQVSPAMASGGLGAGGGFGQGPNNQPAPGSDFATLGYTTRNVGGAFGASEAGGGGGIHSIIVSAFEAGSAVLVAKIAEAWGEKIGNGLADLTKQNLELARSISLLNEQMARSNETNARVFGVATGGTQIDPEAMKKLASLRQKETDAMVAIQNPDFGDRFGKGLDIATGIGNRFGLMPHYNSDFAAKERQYAEAKEAADAQQDQVNGLIRSGRSHSYGAAVGREMTSRGMDPGVGLDKFGGSVEPAATERVVEALHRNTDAQLAATAAALRAGRFVERQALVREKTVQVAH